MNSRLRLSVAILAFAILPAAVAHEIPGRVTRVFDGDSFLLRASEGGVIEVRLAGIDAPEEEQPHADEARAALRALILHRELRLNVLEQDRYGRQVAHANVRELDVNAEMVRQGHAWVYRRGGRGKAPTPGGAEITRAVDAREQAFLALEEQARAAQRGLWALSEAQRVPPWRWRRDHPRAPHSAPGTSLIPSPKATAGTTPRTSTNPSPP